jgi:hypothetical protein
MAWSGTYSEHFLLALDYWAAAVFFNRFGITISTMAGLVRDGLHGPLQLSGWQIAFLRWLEPRLSNGHCEAAKAADIDRLKAALVALVKDPAMAQQLLAALT